MKKTYIFIALIMLTNYTFASTEIWNVNHNWTNVIWNDGEEIYLDDGIDYIVKPVGKGHCLYHNGITPSSITLHSMNRSKNISGQFKINFISHIARWCGYHYSSQDFEVHSLKNPSLSATFQWYSPYAKRSRIRVLNDPHHILTIINEFDSILIGKPDTPPE
ncbi:hypothetical protein [Candidatus Sororendozoicomonas aggregata]|uniref:hypothetical protein n=1 Tax=Candidatus Sororendozoicomonas aggregata TaxID=3073239 RepID=UPI002ED26499